MTAAPPNLPKSRHGCLTAYLVFMIIANSATALVYLAGSLGKVHVATIPLWACLVLTIIGVINLVCAIALFRWKRWGFWGFVASAACTALLNMSLGVSPVSAIVGIVGIAVLYGILQIGTTNKGWPQLE